MRMILVKIWTDTIKIKTLLDIKKKLEQGHQSGPLLNWINLN